MTLDEAIKHAEEVADLCEDSASRYDMADPFESHMACQDGKCAEEHRQLAEWLKELKQLREQTRWIPVTERLPEDRESILLSTKTNEVFEGSYFDDNTNRQWYSYRDETFAWNNVVTAWRPLPESYKAESEEEDE